ncbi:MAG: cyclase family protein [Terrimicrobiaceae bacterium]
MTFFDLSQPLFDNCPNCPAHPPVRLTRTADHPEDGWRMEEFHMASHSGTHLDAPLHKLAGGKSIDQFPLEAFSGPVRVADLTGQVVADQAIGTAALEGALHGLGSLEDSVVLLNTGWGQKRARTDEWLWHSPYLHPEGAEWLVAQNVKGVGIDHFSIGGMREVENIRTHEILLGKGIWVVEELCFREGWKEAALGGIFQALPLFLPGFSGSPCRAVLVTNE